MASQLQSTGEPGAGPSGSSSPAASTALRLIAASQPDIVRSTQKDDIYLQQVIETFQDIVRRMAGPFTALEYVRETKLVAVLLYHALTTGLGHTTLGEEYCNMLQVGGDGRTPGAPSRAALVLLRSLGPYLTETLAAKLDRHHQLQQGADAGLAWGSMDSDGEEGDAEEEEEKEGQHQARQEEGAGSSGDGYWHHQGEVQQQQQQEGGQMGPGGPGEAAAQSCWADDYDDAAAASGACWGPDPVGAAGAGAAGPSPAPSQPQPQPQPQQQVAPPQQGSSHRQQQIGGGSLHRQKQQQQQQQGGWAKVWAAWWRRSQAHLWAQLSAARPWLLPASSYALRAHLALFYLFGVYYLVPHRLAGIRYISTAQPLQGRSSYRALGVLLVAQLGLAAGMQAYSSMQAAMEQRAGQAAGSGSGHEGRQRVRGIPLGPTAQHAVLLEEEEEEEGAEQQAGQGSGSAGRGRGSLEQGAGSKSPDEGEWEEIRPRDLQSSPSPSPARPTTQAGGAATGSGGTQPTAAAAAAQALAPPPPRTNCPLCLMPRTVPSSTPCGHVFCWDCVTAWCTEKPECPLCRARVLPTQLVPLYHTNLF